MPKRRVQQRDMRRREYVSLEHLGPCILGAPMRLHYFRQREPSETRRACCASVPCRGGEPLLG
eukprot:5150262-Prymnesium_polylepis.1